MDLFEEPLKSMKILKKFDIFKICQLLTPTMIIENTQLGKVVSPLKGLEHCFNVEDEKKMILYFEKLSASKSPSLLYIKVKGSYWHSIF